MSTCGTCGASLAVADVRCAACGADVPATGLPGFPLESGIAGWPPTTATVAIADDARKVERVVVVASGGPAMPPPPPALPPLPPVLPPFAEAANPDATWLPTGAGPGGSGLGGPLASAESAPPPQSAPPLVRSRELLPMAGLGAGVLVVSLLVAALYRGPVTLSGGIGGLATGSPDATLTPTRTPEPTWTPEPWPTYAGSADCAPRAFNCEVDSMRRIIAVAGEVCPNRVRVMVRDQTGHVLDINPCGFALGDGKLMVGDPDGDAVVYESLP